MTKAVVKESPFRKQLPEDSLAAGNAYGTLVEIESDGKMLPYICGHGGSMWLCPECADAIAGGNPLPVKACPVHPDGCVSSSMGCTWPDCRFNNFWRGI
jgi:hypothetical protein